MGVLITLLYHARSSVWVSGWTTLRILFSSGESNLIFVSMAYNAVETMCAVAQAIPSMFVVALRSLPQYAYVPRMMVNKK